MKKAVIAMLALGLLAAVTCGCQSAPKGPTDEELINKLVGDWKAAAVAKNLDAMMAFYSDKFQHYEWGDKAGLKSFLKDAIDMGYLENAQVSMDKAKVTVDKEKAKVYPIDMKAAFGSATIALDLVKEGKAWMISGMEVEQL